MIEKEMVMPDGADIPEASVSPRPVRFYIGEVLEWKGLRFTLKLINRNSLVIKLENGEFQKDNQKRMTVPDGKKRHKGRK